MLTDLQKVEIDIKIKMEKILNELFMFYFNEITKTVPFSKLWVSHVKERTYILHPAIIKGVNALSLKPGEMAKTITEENGQKIILVGTRFGNVALYERLGHSYMHPIHCMAPKEVFPLRADPWFDVDKVSDLVSVVGNWKTTNIGTRIEISTLFDNLINWKPEPVTSVDDEVVLLPQQKQLTEQILVDDVVETSTPSKRTIAVGTRRTFYKTR